MPPRCRAELADVDLAASGDRIAFNRIVASTGPHAERFARTLGTSSDLDDVLQESFVAAWNGLSSLSERERFCAWLFTIIRRTATRLRARHRKPVPDTETLLELGLAAGWGTENVEQVVASHERHETLLRVLSTLSDDDREIITLRDIHGLSTAETAAELEIEPGAAKVRLHRARLRLMASMRAEVADG